MEKLQAELQEQKDKYLRLFAEFDNFKRRNAKEKLEMIHTAGKDVISSLLEVLDDCERAEKQLKKGSQVFVEGKLTHRKYQDKEGNDRYVTEVVANSFRVLDRKDSKPGGQDEDFHPEDTTNDTSTPSGSSGEQQADDDLPF